MLRNSLLLTLALACSSSLFAQGYRIEHNEWEGIVFAGVSLPHDLRFPTTVSGIDPTSRTVGMSYDLGYQVGARLDQNLGDYVAADLEYSLAHQHLTFTNLSPGIESLRLSHYLHNITYNYLFLPMPRTKRFRPYGDIGAGAALFFIAGNSKEAAQNVGLHLRDSWEFVFNWGGGVKYLVLDNFAIQFDFKDRISRVPSYGLPPSASVVNGQFRPGLALNGTMNVWQVNFGANFQWNDW